MTDTREALLALLQSGFDQYFDTGEIISLDIQDDHDVQPLLAYMAGYVADGLATQQPGEATYATDIDEGRAIIDRLSATPPKAGEAGHWIDIEQTSFGMGCVLSHDSADMPVGRYTTPPKADGDALDARRYRWIRERAAQMAVYSDIAVDVLIEGEWADKPGQLEAAIDAAIAASPQQVTK